MSATRATNEDLTVLDTNIEYCLASWELLKKIILSEGTVRSSRLLDEFSVRLAPVENIKKSELTQQLVYLYIVYIKNLLQHFKDILMNNGQPHDYQTVRELFYSVSETVSVTSYPAYNFHAHPTQANISGNETCEQAKPIFKLT